MTDLEIASETPRQENPWKTADCRSCHAHVVFVVNDRGRRMCLNAEPDAQWGNVSITVDNRGMAIARVYGPTVAHVMRAQGEKLYLAHQVTCPQREKWARR